jgi:hypothetical protein
MQDPPLQRRSCEETIDLQSFRRMEKSRSCFRAACVPVLSFGLVLAARRSQGTSFSESDPLLEVVSETGPQHFHLHFCEATQVKLSEA